MAHDGTIHTALPLSGPAITPQSKSAEESALSSWAGPYVTDMLGKAQGLAALPYTPYMGTLSAGYSPLQQQAFGGYGGMQLPNATTAGSFTGTAPKPFEPKAIAAGMTPYNITDRQINDALAAMPGASDEKIWKAMENYGVSPDQFSRATGRTITPPQQSMVSQYMNPYLEGALAPQYDAARRQNEIQQQNLQGQYTKAGAYGGGRQAIAEAELQRGLLDRMSGITGQGYEQAYNQASDLFNQDRDYGLRALQGQMNAGTTQRGIESEGIAADIAQFETERDYPYKQLQYQQSMLQGLPLETQTYSYTEPSGIQKLAGAYGDVEEGLDLLSPYAPQAPQAPQGPTSQQQAANYKVIYNSYLGSGMNRTEAAARAVYDITTDPGQKAVMKQQMISQGIKI
tara:strand:- start:27 stop:1223 length:1197 start_codon:yes stop_codon:yes gene_type:complete